MTIQIERGIPVPSHNKGRRGLYPFRDMQVGDSFVVDQRRKASAQRAASFYGKSHGQVFTARSVPDGVRIWRVS